MTAADHTLLVVDDNDDNRYTLVRRLAREGYTSVATATDGEQALALLHERRFDVVLLDIMMPGLNGYQVLEHMRADAELRHIPVIMISAVDQMESVIRCIELGAEDYLAKPFNPTLLRARVGACLEKKRLRDEIVAHLDRIERELTSARDIQLSMVPTDFPVPSRDSPVEIFATLQPARQIGGDLYDFFWSDPATLAFVVADVSDKGAPAALFMARTKTLLRLVTTLLRPPTGAAPQPDEIMTRVNEELCRDNPHGMFATLFFGMLEPASGEVRFCNAGHPVPYLVTPRNGIVPLNGAKGKPAGIRATFRYESASHKLLPGDSLFVFTDGITEAMDAGGALYTEQRLESELGALGGQGPREVVERVLASVRGFTGAAAPSDDIAAMTLRLLE